jgi:nucleotide-binding universal stress UspA family protein
MFTTIVVGTDGSRPSMRAVEAAGELAANAGIDLVHVVSGYHALTAGELHHLAQELPAEFRSALASDTTGVNHCAAAALVLERYGVKAVEHPVAADGAEAILTIAGDVGADLIVVGSHGYGTGERILRGSVSTKVCHHAHCSVLVVHTGPDDGPDEGDGS